MAIFKDIDSPSLQALLSYTGVVLVDVRSDDEVARGIIRDAIHIPLHLLPLQAHNLEGDAPLVFYCHSGVRSAQACGYMAQLDRENLFNLRGGVLGWCGAGFVLEPKK
jgi:rhodanese-related sulfurtransferase